MKLDLEATRVFIRPGATDLRKAARGLSVLAQDEMGIDPFSDRVFLFCNKARKLLKAVYWDKTGFWLCQKRLEEARWPWPETKEEAEELTVEEVGLLLRGIDFWKAHKEVKYERVS
jgi:transposase